MRDAALVLLGHAEALLRRAELAEAELAGATGSVAGQVRIASFQSVALRLAVPAMQALAREAPGLRCELVEAEPEQSLPAPELAGEAWTTGHRDTGWEEITNPTCRELGGFDPDIRHRTNDSVTSLAVVAHGQAVTLLPHLVAPDAHPGVAVRAIAEGSVHRTIFIATRTADAKRPSVQALPGSRPHRRRNPRVASLAPRYASGLKPQRPLIHGDAPKTSSGKSITARTPQTPIGRS